MKKEKQVKSYQRRTKSGKLVTVRAHSAKYDAAEKAKEAAKKKGAGGELEARSMTKEALSMRGKKEADLIKEQLAKYGGEKGKELAKEKKTTPEKKSKRVASVKKQQNAKTSNSPISSAEFKAWYHDPKSKEGKAAAKKLKEQVGAEKYKELNKQANSGYSTRGHLSMFKSISTGGTSKKAPKSTKSTAEEYNFKSTTRSPELAALHYYKTTGKQHPNGFKVKPSKVGYSVSPPKDVKGKTIGETKKMFDKYGNRK